MASQYVLLLILVTLIVLLSAEYNDEFSEELYISPLPTGHIYTHFQFTTTWNVDIENKKSFLHYRLFPKSLGEVLEKFFVQELHLSLTQGLWRHQKWGYPLIDAPPGAELWAWFQEGVENVDKTWFELTNVLSGLICASLNFIDSSKSITPQVAFRPQGVVFKNANSSFVRYAALPREIMCTENLTPWKKLLPCHSRAGLSTLLSATQLYTTNYHSLGMHVKPICQKKSCEKTAIELTQTLSVVFNPLIEKQQGKQSEIYNWSIRKLFGSGLGRQCPLASTSSIYVDITNNKTLAPFTLSPEPKKILTRFYGTYLKEYAVYSVNELTAESRMINILARYEKNPDFHVIPPPWLYSHRFITGYGQENGGIMCILHNTHRSKSLTVSYLEVIPWFIRIYTHTLKIESKGKIIKPLFQYYKPAKDRQRPHHLELIFTLPPKSVTQLSIHFEHVYLKWTEYPPDPNHGFYINSAIISAALDDPRNYTSIPQAVSTIGESFSLTGRTFFFRLHTEVLIVNLPTPDFSMPYNVICLACTVVALAFGPLHNLTTKRFIAVDATQPTGFFGRIKQQIQKVISRLVNKDTKESKNEISKKED